MKTVISFLDTVSDTLGQAVSWLTFLMMLVTFTVVIIRYGFGAGSIALQESVSYMHGAVVMLGIAWTLKTDGHVRVDILYERFSIRTRAVVNLIGTLLFLVPVSLFIFYSSLDYVGFSFSLRESSAQPGGLPGVYLIKALIPAMAGLLLIQGVSEILRSLLTIKNPGSVISSESPST